MTDKENFPSLWKDMVAAERGTASPEGLIWPSPEGIGVKALYTSTDLPPGQTDSLPGQFPFTRGIRATMYTGKPWTIRQYAGFSTVEDTNAFFRKALAAGQTGLSVAFDLATHRGYDSDHPRAIADVGKAGVAVDTVEDMKRLFDGIDLGKVSVSMTMNGAVLPVMAAYIVAAEEQGVDPAHLSGTLQNDILKEFLVRNTYIYPPAPSLRIVADIMAYTAQHLPKFNPVSISGYHMQEAGASAVEELAFTLADGLAYIEAAKAGGLSIEKFAPRLSFFFAVGMNFFMEIAKLRAARLLWAKVLNSRYGVTDPRALMLRTHCQTSGVSLTEQDPLNNITRTAYEALAAVLGGTQSLHTNSYDEALALPSETSSRIARNTQLILAEETFVTKVVDPLGGSYYVEALTAELAEAAEALITKVDQKGGMKAAIESGWVQTRIEESATRRQARVDRGEDIIIGVNQHQPEAEAPVIVREVDSLKVRTQQIERMRTVRAKRDERAVQQALANLTAAAQSKTLNLLEATLPAMRARATVGEVSAALEVVFTRHKAIARTLSGVYAGARGHDPEFARVKAAVAALAQKPRLSIVKLGQDGHDRGAKVVASAFGDLGFAVKLGPLFDSPEEAVARVLQEKAQIAGLSTLAGAHKDLVLDFITKLRAAGGHDVLVVVGGVIPPQDYQTLFEAGVVAIYGPGTNIPVAAEELLGLLAGRNEPPHSRTRP
jgi:methylmalonyl-CoA mutase